MNKKGVAFLTTIILLGVVLITCSALSFMLLKDAFAIKRLKASSQAYYLAEAAAEEAIEYLWTNDFDRSSFSIGRNLGIGTTSASLDISRWASEKILLITSTGTVGNISRTIKTEVKSTDPVYFDYAILSNGKIFVTGDSSVYCYAAIGIHSNDPTKGGKFGAPAIDIVGMYTDCWVYGDAFAVGGIHARRHGHLVGDENEDESAAPLPPFDATFFNWYVTNADANDKYEGDQTFTSNLTPTNGIIYVNGDVNLEGSLTVAGCIVATGDIKINWTTRGTVTQTKIGKLPALMSRGGGIWIGDPTTLYGLVYATGNIETNSQTTVSDDITINGSIISQGCVEIADETRLNYVKQNPPGLTTTSVGWILNWNE